MALAGFQVADIRSRSLNPPGDLLLGEIESAAALANDGARRLAESFFALDVLCRGWAGRERAD
jgi:hypothetical protein